jgi:uracil-DNA glycosylase family 4
MDDGHTRLRPDRQPGAEIATCSFTKTELWLLVCALDRLGLSATARRGRLHFDVHETRKLSELVAPFVIESMRYKLHPEVASRVPFDASRWASDPPSVLYDDVVATEMSHVGSDKTFFCIDVEETHNFVTSGGVVHNCRPPGNRDPQPDEIESCRPWLEAQLDLINPKVVVTLGNFASKLLLDTTTGITKLRGRTYPYRSGVLVPTFHPAAVLRGGAEPEAQMRADLVRAKLALEHLQAAAPA